MDPPNPKRPCHSHSVTSSIENPCSLSSTSGFNQSNIDMTISSFLSLSDMPMFSSPVSIGCSFDRVLDKVISSAAHDDQDCFLDRTLQLASLLHKSTKRCIRKLQNSISWPLLPELTTKVFSMLDTKSLMQASACCTMFNKCAMDPICYSHIDLTTAANLVNNGVVCKMIHRAGKELRSLKLGSLYLPAAYPTLLTRSCLAPLTFNHGFAGCHLRSLYLSGVEMDGQSLYPVLSVCLNLTDLKIVGFCRGASDTFPDQLELLGLLTRSCRLIKHLFIEIFGLSSAVERPPISLDVVDECPNLISLSLLGFRLNDAELHKLIKSSPQLKYLNLSNSLIVYSHFLRELVLSYKDSPLETLTLRDCSHLEEEEVLQFLNSLLAGDFKSIRQVDLSNIYGLISDGGRRTYEPRLPIEELKKERPEVSLVANFGTPASSRRLKYNIDEEYYYYEEEEEENWDYYFEGPYDYYYDDDVYVEEDEEDEHDDDDDDDVDDDEDEGEHHDDDDDEDGDEHGDER